jgi:amidase/6-aminohexanoate-cyclic-dimer hydrolase
MPKMPDYEQFDAVGLGELVRRNEISAAELLDVAIDRVEARNSKLNAVILRMYDEAKKQIAAGLPQGPLSGVPLLLKDMNQPYAGVVMRNGSRLWDGYVPNYDSTLVARFKAAGMVIFGKTATPELGLNGVTEPVATGITRNPWNLNHTPGGSSGGAAAAVAAGMVPMAHAGDGGGSTRIPASCAGLVGLKPSRARNPSGPISAGGAAAFACPHAVSWTVRDQAAMLDAIHGPELGDPYACPPPVRPFLDEVGAPVGRLRIAFTTKAPHGGSVDPNCAQAARNAAALCDSLGHEVEEAAPDYDAHSILWAWRVLGGAGAANSVDARLKELGRDRRQGDLERITELWLDEAKRNTAVDCSRAVNLCQMAGRKFGQFFRTYDVLISPTAARPPMKIGESNMMGGDLDSYYRKLFDAYCFTPQFNATGCTAISLPLAMSDDGLPIGVQFGADFGNEALLLRLSAQIEQAAPWQGRRPAPN